MRQRRGEDFRPMCGHVFGPKGMGDRNRGEEAPQTNDKVFQQYWGAQQNPPAYASGYKMGIDVPFNINESGLMYGSYY